MLRKILHSLVPEKTFATRCEDRWFEMPEATWKIWVGRQSLRERQYCLQQICAHPQHFLMDISESKRHVLLYDDWYKEQLQQHRRTNAELNDAIVKMFVQDFSAHLQDKYVPFLDMWSDWNTEVHDLGWSIYKNKHALSENIREWPSYRIKCYILLEYVYHLPSTRLAKDVQQSMTEQGVPNDILLRGLDYYRIWRSRGYTGSFALSDLWTWLSHCMSPSDFVMACVQKDPWSTNIQAECEYVLFREKQKGGVSPRQYYFDLEHRRLTRDLYSIYQHGYPCLSKDDAKTARLYWYWLGLQPDNLENDFDTRICRKDHLPTLSMQEQCIWLCFAYTTLGDEIKSAWMEKLHEPLRSLATGGIFEILWSAAHGGKPSFQAALHLLAQIENPYELGLALDLPGNETFSISL